jgi:hypothetical protein
MVLSEDAAAEAALEASKAFDATRKTPQYQSVENAAVCGAANEASKELGTTTLEKLNRATNQKYANALDTITTVYPFVTLKTGGDRSKKKPETWWTSDVSKRIRGGPGEDRLFERWNGSKGIRWYGVNVLNPELRNQLGPDGKLPSGKQLDELIKTMKIFALNPASDPRGTIEIDDADPELSTTPAAAAAAATAATAAGVTTPAAAVAAAEAPPTTLSTEDIEALGGVLPSMDVLAAAAVTAEATATMVDNDSPAAAATAVAEATMVDDDAAPAVAPVAVEAVVAPTMPTNGAKLAAAKRAKGKAAAGAAGSMGAAGSTAKPFVDYEDEPTFYAKCPMFLSWQLFGPLGECVPDLALDAAVAVKGTREEERAAKLQMARSEAQERRDAPARTGDGTIVALIPPKTTEAEKKAADLKRSVEQMDELLELEKQGAKPPGAKKPHV